MYDNKYKENAYQYYKKVINARNSISSNECTVLASILGIPRKELENEFNKRMREEALIEKTINLLPNYTSSFEIECLQDGSSDLTLTISLRRLTDLVRDIIAEEA